ncbi:acyl-CoA dehydrogenase family protein [Tolypothrix sp. VBCCA 56010]|uniref:acyl-CoA dehydrogenase family protein n=1 Tax=Tolypothrix sp. VBCCA 56010 TaxID=3137731 RepID=UPI003D7D8ECA
MTSVINTNTEEKADVIRDDTQAIAIAHQLAAEFVKGDSERDRQGKIPALEVNKYSQSGLWGITVPKEYGGAFVSNRA